jgi:Mu transposase, C-terminal
VCGWQRRHAPPVKRSADLSLGQRVLVWYDPTDPSDILVYDFDGCWSDRAFLATGALLVIGGAVLAAFGR